MKYYHCSPVSGLTMLQPRKPEMFEKPSKVYMTTLLPMALMYGVRNYEYSYGYNKEGQIFYEEYFPNALDELYGGKSASLYLCDPENVDTTKIPNEVTAEKAVPILREISIPDVLEALLEQERLGALIIYRYHELSEKRLNWIHHAEVEVILEKGILHTQGPMAEYYRTHYPESWASAMQQEK